MEIKYICTYWGQQGTPVEEFVERAIAAGYDGIELNIPDDSEFTSSLMKAVEQHNAILVAQQWLPPARESVQVYHSRMTTYLGRLASLGPSFINSHSGKDHFSFRDNCNLIESCAQIAKEHGVRILHETHRGRFSHHAASLLPYLKSYPELELNADFSHFCTVSESLLEDQEEIVDRIIPHCHYIHARVGSDQSAQLNHPFAPEWEGHLNRFVSWWQRIIDIAGERGDQVFHICPEAGPEPYMQEIPYTRQPVSDQWEINLEMMRFLRSSLKPVN